MTEGEGCATRSATRGLMCVNVRPVPAHGSASASSAVAGVAGGAA